MMTAVRFIEGRAAPLGRSDIDTDQILPAHWLTHLERTGFADACFESWRRQPGFVLNAPAHAGASILLAGPNFGCGSSREHAVWALQEYGFRAVVSPRFAGIFRENAVRAGLLPVQLPERVVDQLMRLAQAEPAAVFIIDVEHLELRAGAVSTRFELDEPSHTALLHGHDPITNTLGRLDAIVRHEACRPSWMPRPGTLPAIISAWNRP